MFRWDWGNIHESTALFFLVALSLFWVGYLRSPCFGVEMAAPLTGRTTVQDLISSTVLTLVIIPAVYSLWKGWGLRKGEKR